MHGNWLILATQTTDLEVGAAYGKRWAPIVA